MKSVKKLVNNSELLSLRFVSPATSVTYRFKHSVQKTYICTSLGLSVGYSGFTAAPMVAGIKCETEPAIEVIDDGGANAARIRHPNTGTNPNRITQLLLATLAGLQVPFLCTETHDLGEEIVA